MAQDQEKQEGTLSLEESNALVLEHHGWAESIARSVARSWNLDWKLDGLDGAAMEALLFCSRRFKPKMGVPFRGYARKRIHEAATEAARRSKGWRKSNPNASERARDIAVELLEIFPDLRNGEIPVFDEGGDDSENSRHMMRQMLVGASLIAARQSTSANLPDDIVDIKRMVSSLATLEPIHQELLWQVYWEGQSMRSIATEWDTDELNVIREHTVLLTFMQRTITKSRVQNSIRVRPGLKTAAVKLRRSSPKGRFTAFLEEL